ncbi:hypothetical protein HGP17_31720 [Rhizobium sp. P38BS-XIX]|uniref:hypothetical protein n=1 Tax=Rhizobium sp. P38BS-XIX TaxID=2726740 RepID=UPI0014573EFF|nr:hypothetical protein [Rhizobium sp. P38BS-XIX]NLS01426.1 hypothetical protein [Rhizobium sp. P38BS-XIX]
MTTEPEDDHSITVSFVRQPAEHVTVMRQVGRRLAARRAPSAQKAAVVLVLSAIAVGATLPVFFDLLRTYVFIPVFDISPLIHRGDMTIIWLVPTLILYALILIYFRWLGRRRMAMMQAHIRPDILITVTITPKGATWDSQQSSIWLAWSEIVDIGFRDTRIEFDLESFATYIPVSAFASEAEQRAAFARILGFWRAANPVQP